MLTKSFLKQKVVGILTVHDGSTYYILDDKEWPLTCVPICDRVFAPKFSTVEISGTYKAVFAKPRKVEPFGSYYIEESHQEIYIDDGILVDEPDEEEIRQLEMFEDL